MFGGINLKKMQGMMKQLGIAQEEILALRVVIEKRDGSKIFIDNPSVLKIKMQGQESFQISGDVREDLEEVFSQNDVKTVMEKTNCSEEEARRVLKKNNGDLAETIIELSK